MPLKVLLKSCKHFSYTKFVSQNIENLNQQCRKGFYLKEIQYTTARCAMTKKFTAKCPYGKKSHGEVSLRRSVLTAKCPYSEASARRRVRTAKCPTAKSPGTVQKHTVRRHQQLLEPSHWIRGFSKILMEFTILQHLCKKTRTSSFVKVSNKFAARYSEKQLNLKVTH